MARKSNSRTQTLCVDWPLAPKVDKPWTYFPDLMNCERHERIEKVMPYLVQYVRVAQVRAALDMGHDEKELPKVTEAQIMERVRQEIPPPCPLKEILDRVGKNLGLPETDILVVVLRAVERGELILGNDMSLTVSNWFAK